MSVLVIVSSLLERFAAISSRDQALSTLYLLAIVFLRDPPATRISTVALIKCEFHLFNILKNPSEIYFEMFSVIR